MTRSLSLDYLIVCPPTNWSLDVASAALRAGNPGVAEVTPPDEAPPAAATATTALGRVALRETLARMHLTLRCARHPRPVLNGMEPARLARLAAGLSPADLAVVRTGTIAVDVQATALDADRAWCLAWLADRLARLVTALGGVICDPAAQRLLGAAQMAQLVGGSALGHVALHRQPWGPELRWLHTHGLQKFGQPEVEIVAVPEPLAEEGEGMLGALVATLVAAGEDEPALRAGMAVELEGSVRLVARATQPDADHAAPYGRLRLVTAPPPGARPGDDATEAVIAMSLLLAEAALTRRDWPATRHRVERVLAAAPNHPGALALRARLALALGEPAAALEAGMFLAACAPADYRGPYVTGLALLALGRFAEARAALDRAVAAAPDAPDPYDARARLLDRLNQPAGAAADRTRARVLRQG